MKIKPMALDDVVSIDRILMITEEEHDSMVGELDAGMYALDSMGRVWRLVETATGLMTEFTESDGIKRRRGKRIQT